MINKCLQDWTSLDIQHWVENTLGLPQFKNVFSKIFVPQLDYIEQIGIDGTVLEKITDADLQNDFGIKIRIQRVKILQGIRLLQKRIADQSHSPVSRPGAINNQPLHQSISATPPPPPPAVAQVQAPPPPVVQQPRAQEVPIPRDPQPERANNNENINNNNNNIAQHSGQNIIEEPYQFDPIGARQSLSLKAIQGILLNNTFVIGVSGATLGRHSASNRIVISESYVSRKHCEIKYMKEHFYIRDVGSTTGTFVMLRNQVKLQSGMMFQMGLSEFKVTKKLPDLLQMYIFEGPARQTKINVTLDGLRIGRDTNNGFSVTEDSQMSNNHAQIINISGELYLQDRDSTNKTWLRMSSQCNQSEWKMLRVSDIIKIGSTVFTVEETEEEMMRQIDEENKQIAKTNIINSEEGRQICKICCQLDVNVLWNKCRHLYGCIRCAKNMKFCPICRKEGNYTQVYRP